MVAAEEEEEVEGGQMNKERERDEEGAREDCTEAASPMTDGAECGARLAAAAAAVQEH